MNKLIILFAFVLAGCGPSKSRLASDTDRCEFKIVFDQCMKSLPAGPVATQYNDWDEVVDSCRGVASQASFRDIRNIKPECR